MQIAEGIDQFIANVERRWSRPSWWMALIALPLTIGATMSLWECNTHTRVAGRQQTIVGTVTSHDPANHNSYTYTFSVNGNIYSGRQFGSDDLARTVGQNVTVFYDPTNPNMSALTSFDRIADNDAGPVPLMLLGVGGILTFVWYRRRKPPLQAGAVRQ